MDISEQKSKGISVLKMPIILLLISVTSMLFSTSNSFHINDIECLCFGTSAVCSGISNEEVDEIQELLSHLHQNCSSSTDLLDLTLNLENLEQLPDKAFTHFKLQNLTLGYGLKILYHDAFDGLSSSLLRLNLSHNDIEFYGTPLTLLENLKELNLDFNDLTESDVSTFGSLNKLEVLSISGNLLTGLHANFLENMTAIQTLILDHNKNISSFSNISINSSTLMILSAQNCSIQGSLESDSLSGISNLRDADFSSNNLIRINAFALDKLHHLETLNLSNNKIETLKNHSFSSLHNLLVLDLKDNQIKEIEVFSFFNLTKLKILNLAENKLEVFMEKYTSDLNSLEKINLENNQIHIIQPGSFSTCGLLKELLLQGNAFHCDICEVKFIVGFLTNDTLFKKEDADTIKCAAPAKLKDTPLTEVPLDFINEMCEDEDDSTYETEEDSTYETPTTVITTENPTTTTDPLHISTLSGENTSSITSAMSSQSISESTYETDTQSIIISTTNTSFPIIPGSTDGTTEVTELISESTTGTKEGIVSLSYTEATNVTTEFSVPFPETSATTEVATLSMTIPSQTEAITESTSVTFFNVSDASAEYKIMGTSTAAEVIDLSSSEHTTADLETSPQNTSESTTPGTTENVMTTPFSKFASTLVPGIDETSDVITSTTITQRTTSTNIDTESPTVSAGKTDLNREETSEINTLGSTWADFVTTDTLNYSELTEAFTTIASPAIKIPESQMIRIVNYSVSDDEICVQWDMKWEILNKQWVINKLRCGVEILHGGRKLIRQFKNCPTSEREIQECIFIENNYLKNLHKFCVYVFISLFKKLKLCSEYSKVPTTTENLFNHSSTTDLTTLKPFPSTQGTFVPFRILKFDATFNHSKSFVDVNWVVNRNERNSICSLNLILMSHNFNNSEGVFSCRNNSYKIQNIKHRTFQVCLRNFYQGHYAPLLCKPSLPLSYELQTSSMKDDGYKNSALIAVICLLILIVLIVIAILLKKILQKRAESDLYNVSAEEKNVLRRQASAFQQEPCVRYSYTLKEQMEI